MPETRARFLANTIGATSASNDFTLPDGVGSENQVISSNGAGGTTWANTLSAPTITSVTGSLNVYEDSVSEDGGVLTINGTDFGADPSALSVQISGTTGFAVIAETTTISITASGTQFTATFTGAETNYNHSSFVAGSTIYVKVTKSGLQTSTYATLGTAMTGDPSFANPAVTSANSTSTANFNTGASLGSYGGQITGGGDDSNTKLLLNFDRTGGTDIEDSSNIGDDGYKVTANGNVVIKASPFGDGKSAIYFDGSGDYLTIAQSSATDADFDFGTSTDYTIEGWYKATTRTQNYAGILATYSASTAGYTLGLVHHNYTTDGATQFSLCLTTNNFTNSLLSGGSESARFEEWIHFALVRSGSTTSMYINGKLADSTTTSINMASSSGMRIGSNGTDNTSDVMYGYLDEIRIVKGTAVYTGDFTVPTSRLTAITNTKLLIHSNKSGDGVFLGDPIAKTHSITLSPSDLIETYYNADSNYTQYQHLTKEYLINGVREDGLYVSEGGNDNTGDYVRFDCGSGKSVVANGILWAQDRNAVHGTFQVQGSNDASTWTTLTSSDITIGTSSGSVYEYSHYFTNTNAYRYYQIIGTGGNWSQGSGPWIREIALLNNNFTDSSSSTHTITPTGSHHSQGHGGIAPALTFPASLKKTGSAGVFFDGNGDYLTTELNPVIGTGQFTMDFWIYPHIQEDAPVIVETRNTSNQYGFMVQLLTSGRLRFYASHDSGGNAFDYTTPDNANGKITFYSWNHIAVERSSSNQCSIYVNGVRHVASTSNSFDCSEATLLLGAIFDLNTGWSYDGYLDNFRYSNTARYDTSDFSSSLPTQIYGAFRSQDVGTIQLNASAGTGGGALDYAELSGGTALSTYGLELNQSTGAITGTLSGLAENSSSGAVIRIRARANADDNRVTTLNGGSFTGITQNDRKPPVLFDARRYVGNGIEGKKITGFGFGSPDLVWIKSRNVGRHHNIFDSVQGVDATNANKLLPNENAASNTNGYGNIRAFTLDGFTLENGDQSSMAHVNTDDEKYIAWAWKAGGAPVSITSGLSNVASVTQSASSTTGFSITKYTGGDSSADGAGTTGSFPHNLGGTPDFVIVKSLHSTNSWAVWHSGLANASTSGAGVGNVYLDLDANEQTNSNGQSDWGTIQPPSNTDINLREGGSGSHGVNRDTGAYICYAWRSVAGLSAFGSYNGSASGGTVYTTDDGTSTGSGGFKPSFVIIKSITNSGRNWIVFDKFRETYTGSSDDQLDHYLNPNSTGIEGTYSQVYVTVSSNGFTTGNNTTVGANGETYIYMAFA